MSNRLGTSTSHTATPLPAGRRAGTPAVPRAADGTEPCVRRVFSHTCICVTVQSTKQTQEEADNSD